MPVISFQVTAEQRAEAQENTREHAREILEAWKAAHPEDTVRFEAIQQELFGAEATA